jgi:signal transduction histidine kinase
VDLDRTVRFPAVAGGVIALTLAAQALTLYAVRCLAPRMEEAAGRDFSESPAGELRRIVDEQVSRATWVIGIGMALALGLGAPLLGFQARAVRAQAVDQAGLRAALERTRARLCEAEKLASAARIAAGVAHEIRNPLAAVKTWVFSIRRSLPPDAELDRKFHLISEQMARIETMLADFLEFSRPPAALRPQPVAALLAKTVELARYRVRQKGVRVVCDGDPSLPPVLTDPPRLEQVLINLLNNAVDATPQGGEIRLRASFDADGDGGPWVVVRVEDTGTGIPDDARPRIFEPFFTTKETGTGLGLCIAAEIAGQLGGQLVLERSAPGGTSFAVRLPAAPVREHE